MVSPNVLFRKQGEFTQLNVGLYVNKGPLVAGVWHRGYFSEDTRDALIVLLGVQTETMRFGYSYDITISQLTPATGGTHEITLGMRFASPYSPNSERSPALRSDDLTCTSTET